MENNGGKISFNFVEISRFYDTKDVFLVKGQSGVWSVKVSEIKLIMADIQYTKIVLIDNKTFTMRVPLNEWESKLPSGIFKRVHKSTIVNFNFVESNFTNEGKHFLKIENWEGTIEISRRKQKLITNQNPRDIRPILG